MPRIYCIGSDVQNSNVRSLSPRNVSFKISLNSIILLDHCGFQQRRKCKDNRKPLSGSIFRCYSFCLTLGLFYLRPRLVLVLENEGVSDKCIGRWTTRRYLCTSTPGGTRTVTNIHFYFSSIRSISSLR